MVFVGSILIRKRRIKTMSKKHLKSNSHKSARSDFWWYETEHGIDLCIKSYDKFGNKIVKLRLIPWVSIRSALKRMDKKDE